MRTKWLLLLVAICWAAGSMRAQEVRIGVLGIFHPRHLVLSCADDEALVVTAAGRTIFLQPGSSREGMRIYSDGSSLLLSLNGKEIHVDAIHVADRNNGEARFVLSVPGKIRRQYLGTVAVKASDRELVPVITMDLETAVASVVQAESLAGKDHNEAPRLAVGKRLGWSAVPSDTFVLHQTQGEIVLEGVGQGHGIGLCQRGASAMAQRGADFREIILHYFPNTTVSQLALQHQSIGR